MGNYKVLGQSREVGAIGIMEDFVEIITAESSREAYDKVREGLYLGNRDHVMVKDVLLLTDDEYSPVLIEPRVYL